MKYRIVEITIEGNSTKFQIQRLYPTWFGLSHEWWNVDEYGVGQEMGGRRPVSLLSPRGSLGEAKSYIERWIARSNQKSRIVFET